MTKSTEPINWQRSNIALAISGRVDTVTARDALEDIIVEAVASGGRVTLMGFGMFTTRKRAARLGHNPRNPSERIEIPAVTVTTFKPGGRLREAARTSRAVDRAPARGGR